MLGRRGDVWRGIHGAATEAGIVWVGNNLPTLSADALPPDLFLSVGPEGALIRAPSGHQILKPVVVSDGRNTVHLIWGEADTDVETQVVAADPLVVSLWHAALGRDGTWHDVRRILDSQYVSWREDRFGIAVVGDDIYLAVSAQEVLSAEQRPTRLLLVHRLSSGEWQRSTILTGLTSYVALGASPEELDVAAIAWHPTTRRNTMTFLSSRDGGETWSDILALAPDPGTEAHHGWLSLGADGSIDVLWLVRGADTHMTVLRAMARLGNRDWTGPIDDTVPYIVSRASVARGPCDFTHAVMEAVDQTGRPRLLHSVLSGGRWVEHGPLGGYELAFQPSLVMDRGGTMVLASTEVHREPDGDVAIAAYVRRWERR